MHYPYLICASNGGLSTCNLLLKGIYIYIYMCVCVYTTISDHFKNLSFGAAFELS